MQKFLALFGLGMGVFFILAGLSLMFINPAPVQEFIAENQYPDWAGKAVGFIVFVYGLFRLNRSIKWLRNKNPQQDVLRK